MSSGKQVIAVPKDKVALVVASSAPFVEAMTPSPESAASITPPSINLPGELPDKINICIYRFPFGDVEHATCTNWLMNALFCLHTHLRVNSVSTEVINDTPVDMSRNRAIRHAIDNNMDFAVFVDSDMFPDYQQCQKDRDPKAEPFFPKALNYALEHHPCCVGVPYCSQPPDEQVLVMRWGQQETNDPDGQLKLDKWTREDSIGKYGFEQVAALGTGLLLIPIAPLKVMPGPWFSYQWLDKEKTRKVSTEDVVFTRDLGNAGVPQVVFWSAWAGHWKLKLVTRPVGLPPERIPQRFAQAAIRGHLLKQQAAE